MEEITLTPSQEEALSEMLFMEDMFILKGYAGTGKTFLVNYFMDQLETDSRIITTATTHKALSVLNGQYTIHSYLGLRLKKDEDKQVLTTGNKPRARMRDIVIVDEASMLNTDVLKHLLDAKDYYDLKIVFIGDPAQLPPVKEEVSPVWLLEAPSFTLTDVVRQAAESPIITAATEIRKQNKRIDLSKYHNGRDFVCGNTKEMRQYFIDNISIDDDQPDELHFPQIISYKNVNVDMFNAWARMQVLGKPTGPYMRDEYVYVRSAHPEQKSRLEDFVRIDTTPEEDVLQARGLDDVTTMRFEITGPRVDYEEFMVPRTNEDAKAFNRNVNTLARHARKDKMWGTFWKYKESVNIVKHIYAMTCHRSQGSTFHTVIIDARDMYDPKLLYTALTRASTNIFINL